MRKVVLVLILGLVLGCPAQATDGSVVTAENPIIWADVPDPSVIRVGDTYYMTSTTMHMNPGVPIMKSANLVDWEIVNYVYDILGTSDAQTLSNGKNEYGRGSWASSLAYHDGVFYVAFSSQTEGRTFIFKTKDIENGPWERSVLEFTHDMSLLFDDDGRVYLVHGGGDIRLLELTEDASAVKRGGINQVIIPNASAVASPNVILAAEGAHIHKINGMYYIFLITWPAGGMRTQICFRSDKITGPYEGRVVLMDAGIAQGGLIDTPDGQWYALLFGDRGSVGRIPYLVPVTWEDGWPVLGVNGRVPKDTGIPLDFTSVIVASDEFNQRSQKLGAYHTSISSRVTTAPAKPLEGLGKEIIVNGGFE
ncbi:MAG: glycoside hydrolase 43 family protein, partial [Limnochordia bacterium]